MLLRTFRLQCTATTVHHQLRSLSAGEYQPGPCSGSQHTSINIDEKTRVCSFCGKSGHGRSTCFLLHPCESCGGAHATAHCMCQAAGINGKRSRVQISCTFAKSKRMRAIEQRIVHTITKKKGSAVGQQLPEFLKGSVAREGEAHEKNSLF